MNRLVGWRFLCLAAGLLLFPAAAWSTPLTSADLSISALPDDFTYSSNSVTPEYLYMVGGYSCGAGQTCDFSFQLTDTGFSITSNCDTGPSKCDVPLVTIDLTDLVFSSGQILDDATISTTFGHGTIAYSTVADSVTLTADAFMGLSGAGDMVSATFQTEAPPSTVPEPSTASLFGMGLIGVLWLLWRRRSKQPA